MKKLKQAEPPIIFGDGLQTRDFVHVSDVASANVLALDSERNGGVYNIGTGRETTIADLARQLIDISGQPSITPQHAPERKGEIRRSVGDIRKAKTQLQYESKTDLQRDLMDLWNRFI